MPTIKNFTGLNNVARNSTDAGPGDLQVATNVVIDDAKVIVRRTGFDNVYDTAAAHSLNGDTGGLLFVSGTDLLLLGTPTSTTLRGSLTDAHAMAYYYLNSNLYFSNGHETGVYDNGSTRSWGLVAPATPQAANIAGGLTPGVYQVALTYIRADGQESGTSVIVEHRATLGGIQLSNIIASADPGVLGIVVYLSDVDGELVGGLGLHRYTILPNSGPATTNITANAMGAVCKTYNTAPPPAGSGIFFYRGRMYVIDGSTLRYSLLGAYENFELDRGIIGFQSDIKFGIPVENGIWVGTTTELMFLAGKDPRADGGLSIKSRNAHACLAGGQLMGSSAVKIRGFEPRGSLAIMPTDAGIFAGDGNGLVENMTGSRWVPPSTTCSFGIIDDASGAAQYIFNSGGTVYAMNLETGAVCNYGIAFTSMAKIGSTLYGGDAGGVSTGGQPDDDGTVIAAEISKTGVDFGSGFKKSITEVYLHAATAGRLTVTIASDVGTGAATTATPETSDMRNHKVHAPRGAKGRNFSITIQNVAGADFALKEIEATTTASSRRV